MTAFPVWAWAAFTSAILVLLVLDLFGKVPIRVSLPFIMAAVTVSIAASLWKTREAGHAPVGREQRCTR